MNTKRATYIARDAGGGEERIEAPTIEAACRQAHESWLNGDWFAVGELTTVWIDVAVIPLDSDDDELWDEHETVTVRINPPVPACTEDEHDWQAPRGIVGGIAESPGVFGHGGGVIQHECCMHCGCRRTMNSWAQRPDTGEQGLESVTYKPGYYPAGLGGRGRAEGKPRERGSGGTDASEVPGGGGVPPRTLLRRQAL